MIQFWLFQNILPTKGEVSRKFAVISKPPKCLSVSRNKEIIVKFIINYHPSAIKLSIGVSGQRQSTSVWIENVRLMFFKFSHFCFQNALEQITSCSRQELS